MNLETPTNTQSVLNNKARAEYNQRLTVFDFADLFGTTPEQFSSGLLEKIASFDFSYRPLTDIEYKHTVLDILKRLDGGGFTRAGKEGKPRWDKGWQENLDSFVKSNFDVDKLVPRYIRPEQPVRLRQQYVMPRDPCFELNWYSVFRQWLFETYAGAPSTIYEFGCGSGFNVAQLARMYPEKSIFGLDWTDASVNIVNRFASQFGWKTEGIKFDFFEPMQSLNFEPNSLVLTIGALEQTGTQFRPFLDYLLAKGPALCVHIEPIAEWYDNSKLEDYLGYRFHTIRNYWQGYVGCLMDLAKEGKIEIIKSKRAYFGSLYIEGYSQLIWRPLRKREQWN